MESRGYRKMLPVYLGEVGEKFHQKYIHWQWQQPNLLCGVYLYHI